MSEGIALDVHAHLAPIDPQRLAGIAGIKWFPETTALEIDGHLVGMKALFRPNDLLTWMDANNVAQAWISIPPPLYRPELMGDEARAWANYVNDGLTDIAQRSSGRLEPLLHLPLQDPEVSARLAEDASSSGRRRFSAPAGGAGSLVLSDKTYAPLWKVLNDVRASIFFHPGECADGRLKAFYLSNLIGNPYETTVAISHLAMGGVFEEFNGIKFCFAHGGGALPMLAGRLERGFATTRPGVDTSRRSPRTAFRNICVDCITHDLDALSLADSVFGEENVVFGSDWPFPMGLIEPHQQMAGLPKQMRARIFCDNPNRLLGEK